MNDQCPICDALLDNEGQCPDCCKRVPDRFYDGFALLHASEDESIDPSEHTYGGDE